MFRPWILLLGAWMLVASVAACGQGPARNEYAGTALEGAAAGFTLTDQEGRAFQLEDARGKVAVLTFMDSRCTEVCPLTAAELKKAATALGNESEQVVFVGVNVNAVFNSVQDVQKFTLEQRLNELPGWRFLTGEPDALEAVWRDYAIAVQPQAGKEDYVHTSGVFLIDAGGNLRWYLSTPLGDASQDSEWQGPLLGDLVVKRVRELLSE